MLGRLAIFILAPLAACADVTDDFNGGSLNASKWRDCQVDMAREPLNVANGVLSIPVGVHSLGGDWCTPPVEKFHGAEDFDERAAPLFPALTGVEDKSLKQEFCTKRVETLARTTGRPDAENRCIQRQEVRLKTKPPLADRYEYKLRFRLADWPLDESRNVRSMLMQWKMTPVDVGHYCPASDPECAASGWGASPFFSLRFNNGRLYATVQDEHCRCRVTPYGEAPPFRIAATPEACFSTRLPDGTPGGAACTGAIQVEYGSDPVMTTPLGAWTEIAVTMQRGADGRGVIALTQDGRPITTVTGEFGYKTDGPPKAKFKFGHYRDYMPYQAVMEVDRASVRRR